MIAFRSGFNDHDVARDEIETQVAAPICPGPQPNDPQVEQALRVAREWSGDAPSINELCKRLAISRRSLEQRFRSAVGRSPMEEIRRLNLERAAEMLVATAEPVKSIALACGFSGLVHLSVAFRRAYGISPRSFRRRGRSAQRVGS